MIDVHMHIGRLYIGEEPLTPEHLLRFMDEHGIERGCLHPIENPEETHYYVTTNYCIDVADRWPDRFTAFSNVDPRRGPSDPSMDFRSILKEHAERGCKGFGECMSGLWLDDPRLQEIYAACGEFKLPIIFHMDTTRSRDDLGLPRLEAMARKFPDTIFIGHAQHFWAEISGDAREEQFQAYPTGPVAPDGAVPRLFRELPNVYADISAGSGYYALTRDPAFGYGFLNEFADRLMFGTDICRNGQEFPIFAYLEDARATGKVSEEVYRKVAEETGKRVFGL